jgi:AraC-like DNA-binding protein
MVRDIDDRVLRRRPVDVVLPPTGVFVLESHHARTFHMEMGSWAFHKLCWVPVGQGSLGLPGADVPIVKDDVLILRAGTSHRFVDDPADPLTLLIACVSPAVLDPAGSMAGDLDAICELFPTGRRARPRNRYQLNVIRDLYRQMLHEQSANTPGASTLIHSALGRLVVQIMRGCTDASHAVADRDADLEAVLHYLDDYFARPVQLKDLAQLCGVSVRRFTDLFRQRTGRTLVDYLNRRRVEYSQERLRVTENIAYACYESGFQDIGYFHRVFKKYTGQTPGDFIASCEARQ